MSPTPPLISVVIPTFNQARYLPEAIESVLQQTYAPIEIIVVDDGSTDETELISKTYHNTPHIIWIKQANQGPASARNSGIALAQGEYIALLDSDDLMAPQRIALQMNLFEEDPSVDIIYTALTLIDSNSQPVGQTSSEDLTPPDFLARMLFRNLIPTSSVLLAKSQCLKTHPYNSSYQHAEDYELMLRLAHHYHFKYLHQPLTSYRRHLTNLSNNLEAHRETEKKVVQDYSRKEIEQIIEKTSLSSDEKTMLLGRILYNQEKWHEALQVFQKNSSSFSFFYQGNCYLRLKEPLSAIDTYQQALALDKTNPACHNNLGVAFALSHKMELAKLCFQKALKLNSSYLDAQFNLHNPAGPFRITWRELRTTLIPYNLL